MEPRQLPAQPVARAVRRSLLVVAGIAAAAAALAALALLAAPGVAAAHALSESYQLPVPLWLYLWGAFAAVAASFVVVAVADTSLAAAPAGRSLESTFLRHAASLVGAALGMVLWFGAIVAGLFGLLHPFLPATIFWVLIWAGFPIVAAVVGNPWPPLSPFRTLYDLAARAIGRELDAGLPYPRRAERWPAVALLLVGLALELTVPGSGVGGFVAVLLLGYTLITFAGMVLFGPVTWLRNGEVLEALFGWFGRIGPVGRRSISVELCGDCQSGCDPVNCVDCPECVVVGDRSQVALVLRRPMSGLAEVRGAGWSDAAFILLALAGVTFDGLQDTPLWVTLNRVAEPVLGAVLPREATFALIGPLGLVGVWFAFLAAFAVAAMATRRLAGARLGLSPTAGTYAASLLPIAAGYAIAHYLTLLIQGVASLPGMLLSPGGVEAELDWLPAGFVWYLSVGAIVVGHVAAVLLAHREALRLRARHPAIAELPLVGLMLGYTVLSLWIIAQPITTEVP